MDRVSGAMSLLSRNGLMAHPASIARAPDGWLYVADGGASTGVLKIDPVTGAQALIASGFIESIVIDDLGNAFVIQDDAAFVRSRRHIYRFDLVTGSRTRLSTLDLHEPGRIAIDGQGNLVVADNQHEEVGPAATIFRVNSATEAVTLVSTDPQFMVIFDLAVAADGTIFVADHQSLISCAPPGGTNSCPGAIFKVSPSTGGATLLSSGNHFFDLRGLEIYRGPDTTTPTKRSSWGRVKAMYR